MYILKLLIIASILNATAYIITNVLLYSVTDYKYNTREEIVDTMKFSISLLNFRIFDIRQLPYNLIDLLCTALFVIGIDYPQNALRYYVSLGAFNNILKPKFFNELGAKKYSEFNLRYSEEHALYEDNNYITAKIVKAIEPIFRRII